jgi:phage terminase large subunit
MMKKGYHYGQHFLPHDGRARGADNLSFADKLRNAGLANVEVLDRVPNDAANKRIRAMHDLFSQLYFNSETLEVEDGLLDALDNYHYKETKKDGRVTNVVEHDYSSHFADSFGYFAEALMSGRMIDNLSKRGVGRAKASFGNS